MNKKKISSTSKHLLQNSFHRSFNQTQQSRQNRAKHVSDRMSLFKNRIPRCFSSTIYVSIAIFLQLSNNNNSKMINNHYLAREVVSIILYSFFLLARSGSSTVKVTQRESVPFFHHINFILTY